MNSAQIFSGLGQRLLVAAARAHDLGQLPADGDVLAQAANTDVPGRTVDRAFAHLAEDGLIEGVCTHDGWFQVRITARGLQRAGQAGRALPTAGVRPAVAFQRTAPSEPTNLSLIVNETMTSPALDEAMPRAAASDGAYSAHGPAEQPARSRLAILPSAEERGSVPDRDAHERRLISERFSLASVRPHVVALRSHVAQAWHTLTTFP